MMNNEGDYGREQESYKEALKLKDEGNKSFKNGDLKMALKSYSRMFFPLSSLGIEGGAINRKEEDEEDDPLKKLRKDADMLRKTCFNNISAVYAKMGDWEKSLDKAQKVLEMDEKNLKALFRSGVAYRNMREFEKAKESLLDAQKIRDSASIRNELKRVEAAVSAQRAKDDKRLRRAFKKAKTADKVKSASASKDETMNSVEQKEDAPRAMNQDEVVEEDKEPCKDANKTIRNDNPVIPILETGSPAAGESVTNT